jgi:sec-independent protein translocase protein TatA
MPLSGQPTCTLRSIVGDILQPTHLLLILVVALLVLGPKRLPEVGRSVGKGIRDFKDAVSLEHRGSRTVTEASSAADPTDAGT